MIKFRFLTYTNFGLFEKWYEDMAEKGWQIESIPLPFVHKFKKVPAAEMKYRVIMAPNEGYYSAFNNNELEEFDQISKDFGWNLVDRSFNLNVYKLEEGAANSLYNDDKEEKEILTKGIKGEIIAMVLNLFIFLGLFFLISGSFYSTSIFYSNSTLFNYPASILLLVFIFLSLGDYIVFKKRNKNVAAVRDMKFSKLSFSKAYTFLICVALLLIILGLIFQIISLGGNVEKIGFLLLPLFLFFITFFSIKKVKRLNKKTRTKKILMIVLPIVFIILVSIGGSILMGQWIDNDFAFEDSGDFKKLPMGKSVLTSSHDLYESKDRDLRIEKTKVKNEKLSLLLFERIIKNASNHPYESALVKDLTGDFPYEKTYRLAGEKSFLVLYGPTVLEVDGDIYDRQVQEQIEKLLEVERWLGINSKH